MSVPALTNGPWTFSVNNDCTQGSYIDTQRCATLQVKTSLVSFSAWAVVASCDSVSVKNIGDGSPDLWADWATDLVNANAGIAHSWIILQNSTTGEQLCIDLNISTAGRFDVWYSATGSFNTDGTTTNRPTDTESVRMWLNTHNFMETAARGAMVHAMISADNKCTRFFVSTRYGSRSGAWFGCLEELYGTPAVWTSTHKRLLYIPSASIATADTPPSQDPKLSFLDGLKWWAYLKDASPYEGWNVAYSSCECYKGFYANNGDPFFRIDRDQDWNGGYPCSPIGIFRESATRGGALGAMKDIYFGSYFHDMYSTYDGDTPREWIKMGGLIVPWNGSIPAYITAGWT